MNITSYLFMAICPALGALGIANARTDTSGRRFGRAFATLTSGLMKMPGNIVRETQAGEKQTGFTLGAGVLVSHELVSIYELFDRPFPALPDFLRNSIQSLLGTISNNLVRRTVS